MNGDVEQRERLRMIHDPNALTNGIVARWGLDKAVLPLCAAKICRLAMAEAVREEVEENLLLHATELDAAGAQQLPDDYEGLIKLARPEIAPYPDRNAVLASRRPIAREADVPVLVSAMNARPDWLLTRNTKRFTQQVAKRTGLQIGTPAQFFRQLSQSIS